MRKRIFLYWAQGWDKIQEETVGLPWIGQQCVRLWQKQIYGNRCVIYNPNFSKDKEGDSNDEEHFIRGGDPFSVNEEADIRVTYNSSNTSENGIYNSPRCRSKREWDLVFLDDSNLLNNVPAFTRDFVGMTHEFILAESKRRDSREFARKFQLSESDTVYEELAIRVLMKASVELYQLYIINEKSISEENVDSMGKEDVVDSVKSLVLYAYRSIQALKYLHLMLVTDVLRVVILSTLEGLNVWADTTILPFKHPEDWLTEKLLPQRTLQQSAEDSKRFSSEKEMISSEDSSYLLPQRTPQSEEELFLSDGTSDSKLSNSKDVIKSKIRSKSEEISTASVQRGLDQMELDSKSDNSSFFAFIGWNDAPAGWFLVGLLKKSKLSLGLLKGMRNLVSYLSPRVSKTSARLSAFAQDGIRDVKKVFALLGGNLPRDGNPDSSHRLKKYKADQNDVRFGLERCPDVYSSPYSSRDRNSNANSNVNSYTFQASFLFSKSYLVKLYRGIEELLLGFDSSGGQFDWKGVFRKSMLQEVEEYQNYSRKRNTSSIIMQKMDHNLNSHLYTEDDLYTEDRCNEVIPHHLFDHSTVTLIREGKLDRQHGELKEQKEWLYLWTKVKERSFFIDNGAHMLAHDHDSYVYQGAPANKWFERILSRNTTRPYILKMSYKVLTNESTNTNGNLAIRMAKKAFQEDNPREVLHNPEEIARRN